MFESLRLREIASLRIFRIAAIVGALAIQSFVIGNDIQAQTFTLSGVVIDAASGEYIVGATVVAQGEGRGAATNLYGFYSLHLQPNFGTNTSEDAERTGSAEDELRATQKVVFRSLGYKDVVVEVKRSESQVLNVELEDDVVALQTAVVEAERSTHTQGTELGQEEIAMDQIRTLPALFGEVDIMKVIQLLPGIQSAGDGNAGFYVRGGGPDQNLLLLDNAPIYNASHLFGFFSVFNADAIKHVEVIKGAMPAEYGGRISSVLDIGLKEGNSRARDVHGGIGLISSRLTVEAPLVEDTASFILSGRRTYIDQLMKPLMKGSAFDGSGYYFYDLNAKVNWKLNDRDQLFLSGYFGRDVFSFASGKSGFSTSIPWGNAMGSFRWNRIVNDQLFWKMSATMSDYHFAFSANQDDFIFGFDSGIRDYALKGQFAWYPNPRHQVKAGYDLTYHNFVPTDFFARSDDTVFETGQAERTLGLETGVYVQDDFDLTEKIRIRAGLRHSSFTHLGPYIRYVHPDVTEDPLVMPAPPDTISYASGTRIKTYSGWEPRLAVRMTTGPRSSIKAGYSQNFQYVHLVSLSQTSMPADVWLSSSDKVKPQEGTQYSLGYFQDLGRERKWEASVEGYYKDLRNLIAYRENTSPEDNIGNNVDNNLVTGTGWSYGLECFLKRRKGDLTGWIGYTWSKTERQFDDLNEGRIFPSKFDRRHDVSVVLDWKIDDRWRIAAAWVYATGNAMTLPVERYLFEGQVVQVYGERNGYRMAAYHRADISATLVSRKQAAKRGSAKGAESSWVFGVYNLYNRLNPYFIYFENEGSLADGTLDFQAKQVSLFPIIPSVAWNFQF